MVRAVKGLFCFVALSLLAGCTGNGSVKNGGKQYEILTDLDPDVYYANGYTNNTLVGIDQFGRTFEAVAEAKEGKRDVGIFYFCTLGQHGFKTIYNVEEILKMENGVDLLFHQDTEVAPNGEAYFWGEPLYGYYNSADVWVIRKHLKLLACAGVDFLVFDVTNAVTYDVVTSQIMREICNLVDEGFENVPKVAFYTNAYSLNIIRKLYDLYYKPGKFKESWYYLDGKPMIVGFTKPEDHTDFGLLEPLSEEILNFFTFMRPQWPDKPVYEDSLPWIEWTYPAPVHGGRVINVCVASHPQLPMSFSITRGAKNWGRGWNVATQQNESENAIKGTFFQSTWDVAIEKDPPMVFVTGWNEWVAGKFEYEGEYVLVDCANMEFSRDAEMMKGGYNDAFYIQLAANIRRYKGISVKNAAPFKSERVTVNLDNDFSEWEDVKAVFREVGSVNEPRDFLGAVPSIRYKMDAARNNVTEVRVAQDEENIYFYISATDYITAHKPGDSNWMNIFIGTGDVSGKGWECYEYVVNRNILEDNYVKKQGRYYGVEGTTGKSTVEKLKSDFSSEKCGEAEFSVYENVMQVKIPRKSIGLGKNDNSFYFKIADNIEKPNDIMDYYVSGKSLPMGRLSFRYMG